MTFFGMPGNARNPCAPEVGQNFHLERHGTGQCSQITKSLSSSILFALPA